MTSQQVRELARGASVWLGTGIDFREGSGMVSDAGFRAFTKRDAIEILHDATSAERAANISHPGGGEVWLIRGALSWSSYVMEVEVVLHEGGERIVVEGIGSIR